LEAPRGMVSVSTGTTRSPFPLQQPVSADATKSEPCDGSDPIAAMIVEGAGSMPHGAGLKLWLSQVFQEYEETSATASGKARSSLSNQNRTGPPWRTVSTRSRAWQSARY